MLHEEVELRWRCGDAGARYSISGTEVTLIDHINLIITFLFFIDMLII